MARLSIGDHVSDLAGSHDGRLIEIDGKTGYVMQKNGVEIEFALDRLKPYEEPKAARTQTGAIPDRALSPAHRTLLASVPSDILGAVKLSYDKEAGTRPPFETLSDEKKLNTIRMYLPSLPRHLLSPHLPLVVAFRDLAKTNLVG